MRMLDPLLPMMAVGFGTTVSAVAILVAAFMLPYGAGQIATGPLGDRFGKVLVAGLALLLYGAVTVSAIFAETLAQVGLIRAAGGLAAGAVIPLLMAHVGDSVPYEQRQAAIGKFLTGNVMATLLAGPISGVLGEHLGWRASFVAGGAMAAGVGAVLLWRLRVAGTKRPARGAASAFRQLCQAAARALRPAAADAGRGGWGAAVRRGVSLRRLVPHRGLFGCRPARRGWWWRASGWGPSPIRGWPGGWCGDSASGGCCCGAAAGWRCC
jgi:MFS family permease